MAAGIHFLDAAAPPGMHLYAIGDVHGCLDLLVAMHERIRAEISRDAPADWRIVHLGDYVDRGPDSKGVLDFLIDQCAAEPRILALAGNHDVGFLDFLEAPLVDGLFARNGGERTALSYGVSLDLGSMAAVMPGHAALVAAVPRAHVDFVEGLPASVSFGDFFFCHAGVRPGVALEAQDPADLVWIRGEFLDYPGLHPKVVVHGHTPAGEPEVMANRVNVDTAAFMTGRLSALAVEGKRKWFLEVGR